MEKVIKSVDLSNIKLKGNRMDWINSIGAEIPFVYDGITGSIFIIGYKSNQVLLEYGHYQKWMSTGHLKNGKIGELIGKNTIRFKYEIGQRIVSDNVDITIINRKYEKRKHGHSIINEKYYQYKCNKCGFDCGEHYKMGVYYNEFWIVESDLSHGTGCSCCCATPQIVVNGINDIPTTAPWMVDYFQGGYDEAKKYLKSGSTEIYPICPDCGKIKNKKMKLGTIYAMHGISCQCMDGISYPEKYISKLLDQLGIKYIKELTKTTFDWCKNYRYDFYLIDYNYIIETHGIQHYKESTGHFNSDKTLAEQIKTDNEKESIAKQNGIDKYIIIDCRYSNSEWISKSIIKSELNILFDLNNVSFNLCAEFANSNIKKEVCQYYNMYKHMGCKYIAKHFNINVNTVASYLREGNSIGWCTYNKTSFCTKEVYVYTLDNTFCGSYRSIKELCRKSVRDFGVQFTSQNVSSVCRGEHRQHKGYIFSYVKLEKTENQSTDSLLLCSNE